MTETVVLIRHFQDQDNLFCFNDSPVVEAELPKARIASAEILTHAEKISYSYIYIFTSSKQRAETTAQEIAREINGNLQVVLRIDSRIREIDQGKYILPEGYKVGDYFQPLQDAWSAFFRETFEEGNLRYRFGDSLLNGDRCKYPELVGHFSEFGENQIEFSIRFYSFLIDLCQKFKNQKNILPVVVTHQALTARFAELIKIAEKMKAGSLSNISPGTLPLLEWRQFEEIKGDRDIFIEFGGLTTLPLTLLYDLVDILISEVEFLKKL